MNREKKITICLLAFYLILLSWIILLKMQFSFSALPHIRQVNLLPFRASVIVNGRLYWNEIINNMLVFLPVGAYLSLLMPGRWFFTKLAVVCSISLSYEVLQFLFAIGASDVTDLFSNTLGGGLGIAAVWLLTCLFQERAHRLLNRAALVCTALLTALIAVLLAVN